MITISKLTIGYTNRILIKDLQLELIKGDFLCVLGKNGVGKSSFLKSFYQKKYSKNILLENKQISKIPAKELANKIAYISTQRSTSNSLTVYEYISLGFIPQKNTSNYNKQNLIDSLLKKLNIEELRLRNIVNLSDGEFQKIQICRALAQQTKIILFDEPTSFMDYPTKINLYHILKKIAFEEEKIILISSHDIELAWKFSNKTLLLNGTGDFFFGDSEKLKNGLILNKYFKNSHFSFNNNGQILF